MPNRGDVFIQSKQTIAIIGERTVQPLGPRLNPLNNIMVMLNA